MTQVATTQDPLLETAERCLLAPFDLEAAALGRVFGLLGAPSRLRPSLPSTALSVLSRILRLLLASGGS